MKWVVAAALLGAASGSALATEPWVGRWAASEQSCGLFGGSTAATAALVVTDTGLSWFSGYCRIGKMYKLGQAAYIQARCDHDVPVTLDPRGDRMRVTWAGAKEELRRCK